MSVLKKQKFEP